MYIEILFCNGFMDFDYKHYIKKKYLSIGFNAEKDNPYILRERTSEDTYSRRNAHK
ncbi:hypothetical protein [Clostridium saccharobutylicum]|uniref:hypothetical protein n=1 Tax=Clostridium saccharobutylicum TaxID=169679 RepID=UPI0012DB0241|nr:hypothetical protein [Clostridium saccharobutylicum]MBC2437122.1 hypothetical protein [Clostridium saccharobutylicum]NYC30686.1 hypothetical protein [Clostridium saccharobutylicum]